MELAASTTRDPFVDSLRHCESIDEESLVDEELQAEMPISKRGKNRRIRTL